jgi:hypothetical protein
VKEAGVESERREGGAGGEQQVKAVREAVPRKDDGSERNRTMCLEARVGRGDEQEAGKAALVTCRNGRHQTGAMPYRGEAPQY